MTPLKVIDIYGVELIHSRRERHTLNQTRKRWISNYRWIVGGKLNQSRLTVDWELGTAISVFHPLILRWKEHMIVLNDDHFHAQTGRHPV